MFSLILISSALAAASPEGGDARLLNVRDIVKAEDYPLVSLRNEEQGAVTIRLRVDESGTVIGCEVTESSGHPELDRQSCSLFTARARFEPAKDKQGRAIESDYTQRVSWKLADGSPMLMPRSSWVMRTTIGIDSSGQPVDCKLEYSAAGVADCGLPPALRSKSPSPVVRYAINEAVFYPEAPDTALTPPELDNATLAARQTSELTISPDGQIIACKAVSLAGVATAQRDRCLLLSNLRFQPAPEAAGPTVGTLVQTDYVRGAAPAR